jgi:hypothetical protein
MRCRLVQYNLIALVRPGLAQRFSAERDIPPMSAVPRHRDAVFTSFRGFPIFLVAGALTLSAPALGQAPGMAESPTFQGHGAEMQMRDEAVEQRRRALFFDAAAVEIGPPGLPCDHLVKRRPEAVAGKGFVVLLNFTRSERVRQARVWIPPGEASSLDEARRHALEAVAAKLPEQQPRITDAAEFVWCR